MDTESKLIAWDILHETLEHFSSNGFKQIEVPWMVSEEAIRSTFKGHQDESYPGLYLIGSAEQSFVELLLQKKLDPTKKYVTLTPCFRNEMFHDEFTRPYFMKVELFKPYEGNEKEAFGLASMAAHNFRKIADNYMRYNASPYDLQIVTTNEGYDIEINGVEVGSYGVRHYKGHSWVYGTGLAEPRFSTLMVKIALGKL